MSSAQTYTPTPIQVTANALNKVRSLVEEEENPNLALRVYVTGGGCSGFQYGFSFEETLDDEDTLIEKDGVKVIVDAMSYPYLVGAKVDYKEGLQGSRFTVENPNASSTCGCGSSFSI
ncbi:MAG: iron-sulfur cluster insertion protein ErpA [Marinagarivorans sp.]|nr:iron-sulfur cluster insertion protein ErpA [Marinagarivorans sp.]